MSYQNEANLAPIQVHFLRSLLDGKREISEQEAKLRAKKLALSNLVFPCAIICISPFFSTISFDKKDETIQACSDFVCRFLGKETYRYYCLTNSYDNLQIVFPTAINGRSGEDLDELFIRLHHQFNQHFGLELFIGIGSVVDFYTEISRSSLEAMEMLAFKNQYSDRGVVNIINTSRFKHYSLYGEDIMFARVLGRFQDGDLGMMAVRLNELVESIRQRPGISKTTIKRTFIELAVNILHIASNADVDVDSIIEGVDIYNWILLQNDIASLSDWLLGISAQLLENMEVQRETEEKKVITQACDYIAMHLTDPTLSLQTVSGAVGLSSSYFSQLFKQEKGIGLSNYITDCRISQAQLLLRTTDLKSEDVALQLGFTSATYFGRVFKKSVGITPNDFRKKAENRA